MLKLLRSAAKIVTALTKLPALEGRVALTELDISDLDRDLARQEAISGELYLGTSEPRRRAALHHHRTESTGA